ncbi:SPOR domain-containing protein [Novosphingobium sp. BL-8A]|uniref:SPOR domain-containing protein n=1 Tax=Novosphingobium sp. BL-8A TaxID=3127639 RepID=UPI003756BB00
MQNILRFLSTSGVAGCMLCAASVLIPAPAAADVKAGVDAWSDGKYEAAVKQWQPLADKGDADAEFNLAQAYKMGRGVPLDLGRAETLYGKAASQGHVQAADNYGLLLFQRGEREKAMPYIAAAAGRGDARAQYILGVACFNGDLAEKDWVRAYALVSLAQQAGLPQATRALAQMDEHIPLEQRQESVPLATKLAAEADAARTRIDASASLGGTAPAPNRPQLARESAVDSGPATAGADYARPAPAIVRPTVATPKKPVIVETMPTVSAPPSQPAKLAVAKPAPPKAVSAAKPPVAASVPAPAKAGGWRLQLGAFGVAANADKLWSSLSKRPELSGSRREQVRGGPLTFLYATGFASKTEADKACAALKSAGHECIATPPK